MNRPPLTILLSLMAASSLTAQAAEPASPALTLDDAVSLALTQNPELAAANANSMAERAAVVSRYWPESPRLEYMRENKTDLMTLEMGPMNSWGVTQELLFPAKYFYLGAAQGSAANAARERARLKAHDIRQKVISSYFEVFSMNRTLALLEAQKETLREVSRIAESRRATGAASQQDEMKAHVEQTKIETDLVMARQEFEAARAELNALLNRSPMEPIPLPQGELPAPKLLIKEEHLPGLASASSSAVAQKRFEAEQASRERALARLSYLPDFMVSYSRPYTTAPEGAYTLSVGFSVPLWFFAKQRSETGMAGAKLVRAEKELEMSSRDVEAQARALFLKAKATQDILRIYETSLIPQAGTTMNNSRSAYQAGRVGFFDLLDSERSLYEIRINYYRTLAAHAKNVAALETVLGRQASSLVFPDFSAESQR